MKILLVPPKYEIIMVQSNFTIASCKVIAPNLFCLIFASFLYCFLYVGALTTIAIRSHEPTSKTDTKN